MGKKHSIPLGDIFTRIMMGNIRREILMSYTEGGQKAGRAQ
jgi:hypothetical protein